MFTYTEYNSGSNPCSLGPYHFASVTQSQTYKIKIVDGTVDSCGIGSYGMEYYLNGSTLPFDTECMNWSSGDTLQTFTERFGSNSHIGAIGYWYTKYCTGYSQYGCSPTTQIGSVTKYEEDTRGRMDLYNNGTWPNWNTCDKADFPTTTSCSQG